MGKFGRFDQEDRRERSSEKRGPEESGQNSRSTDIPSSLLDLQRLAGNRAVSGLLQGIRPANPLPVRPESDPGEVQADRVAKSVSGETPAADVSGAGDREPQPALIDRQSLQGAGQPLSPTARRPTEQVLKSDLSDVRVHTDAGADRASRQAGALAMTVGNDIYFRRGTFDGSGRNSLLAHELTHVAQQGSSPSHSAHLKRAAPRGLLSKLRGLFSRNKAEPSIPRPPASQLALAPLVRQAHTLGSPVVYEGYRLGAGEEIYLVSVESGKALVERTLARGGGRLWIPTDLLRPAITGRANLSPSAIGTVFPQDNSRPLNGPETQEPSLYSTTIADLANTPQHQNQEPPPYSTTIADLANTPQHQNQESPPYSYSTTIADEENSAPQQQNPDNPFYANGRSNLAPNQPSTSNQPVPSPISKAQSQQWPVVAAKYWQTLQIKSMYKGENLSVEEAEQQGLSPRRHAFEAQRSFQKDVTKAQEEQGRLLAELQNMKGMEKSDAYGKALAQAYNQRDKELKAAKLVRDLGLEGAKEQLENYKVRYLESEPERAPYRVQMGEGGLVQGVPEPPATSPPLFDTSGMTSYGSLSGWAVFVMDPDGKIYAAEHRIQRFHHSTFLAGGDTAGAGEIKVINGKLKGITNKTGHYWAGEEHVINVLKELAEWGVDLTGVEVRLKRDTSPALELLKEDAATLLSDHKKEAEATEESTAPLAS